MEKNWIEKWLNPISQGNLQDLSKLISVLKDSQERLGTDTFEIPYQAFHGSGIKGNIQDWLKNLNRKGVITIWYENKSHGVMRFAVGTPYDEYEEKNISSGAAVELNSEKFEAVYLWLSRHVLQNDSSIPRKTATKGLKKMISRVIKMVKGKKEKKLLEILSDFNAHKRRELIGKTGYPASLNALSQMKIKLNKVIKPYGFYISTEPPVGFIDPTGFYQLKQLTNS